MREHGGCGSRGRFRPSLCSIWVQQIMGAPGNGDGDDEVAQEAGLAHVHFDQKMR